MNKKTAKDKASYKGFQYKQKNLGLLSFTTFLKQNMIKKEFGFEIEIEKS